MKNKDDYDAGWTTPAVNPATKKTCSGGAARNMKLAQLGGANAIQVVAAVKAVQSLQPIIEAQQAQIQQQQSQIERQTKALTQAIDVITKASKNK
ncbi:hypothetical protein MXF26_08185 [Pantoea dispersa]|uniref:hypothetical protein n=1 Tax=Pantoea dispersa TaxID=59814 RepID=UPI002DB9DCFD|nr:hypothetical protein [Pantoea dispersa]MEB5836238.1 hypothetical protein [Pantoea dispersa]